MLKTKYQPTVIIANGENAAAGRGITKLIANEMFELGVHCITLGNHTWDQKEIFNFIADERRIVRPANFPEGTPGQGWTTIKAGAKELVVINVQGRTFLPPLDCPFRTVDKILDGLERKERFVLVDFHAEATSEKIAMGWYLDGKVSAVVGTHTHVQSHDERILLQNTAYVTDIGMVGPRDGVLGMERNAVIQKFTTSLPVKFTVDEGKWHFHAALIEVDNETGFGRSIQLIRLYEDQFVMS